MCYITESAQDHIKELENRPDEPNKCELCFDLVSEPLKAVIYNGKKWECCEGCIENDKITENEITLIK